MSPVADQSSADGATVSLDVAPSFSDDDSIGYTASGLPAGLSISAAGTITRHLAGERLGDESLYGDGHGDRRAGRDDDGYFHLDGVAIRRRPCRRSPIRRAATARVSLDVAPSFSDDDSIGYTASGLPSGLSISAAGTITRHPAGQRLGDGPYTVTVTATDAQGATTTDTFTWTVTNPAPTVSPVADQTSSDGAAVSLDVAPSFADDDHRLHGLGSPERA